MVVAFSEHGMNWGTLDESPLPATCCSDCALLLPSGQHLIIIYVNHVLQFEGINPIRVQGHTVPINCPRMLTCKNSHGFQGKLVDLS